VRTFAKVFGSSEGRKAYMILRELSRYKDVFNWFRKVQIEKYEGINEKCYYRKKGVPFGDEVSAWRLSAKILGK